ncbi:MAG TPA: hypothetical protein VK604_03255 [Bryobacteraceae bacterium]|nr:hypothetical protein [Bryobacteraceae bacterium]
MRTRLLLLALLTVAAQAHVGNPDIYLEGNAGPYRLFVAVRPPTVIPGVAEIEVRSRTADVRELRVVPLPLSGKGAQFAPVADKLTVSPQDPQFFTGSVWLMAHGSWQVRLTAAGRQGTGTLAVPLPSIAQGVKKMQLGLGVMLGALGLFLVLGLVAMTWSGIREAKLEPGAEAGASDKRRAATGAVIAAVVVAAVVWGGNAWWSSEAAVFDARVYKPLVMHAALEPGGVLTLKMTEPGWMNASSRPGAFTRVLFVRKMDDLVPDHNHLMHLYALREPGLDVVYHLHPSPVETGLFRLILPDMPAGAYKLYGDIVHTNGFAETMVTTVQLPAVTGRALAGDDATGSAKPWTEAAESNTFTLPDGYRMEWLRGSSLPHAKEASLFQFRLLAPDGSAPHDMKFYMGMLGHAAFVKTDGSAFAHIHPDGTAAMAALMLTGNQSDSPMDMDMHTNMPGMKMGAGLPNEVSFPYGFPASGHYRIIVQMKHGETVETGIFDANVT